jgi:hypothetical protein
MIWLQVVFWRACCWYLNSNTVANNFLHGSIWGVWSLCEGFQLWYWQTNTSSDYSVHPVLPAMPMWLGTHTKVILRSRCNSWGRRSRISTRGYWRFLFSIALPQDRESHRIRKCCLVEWPMMSRARRIAIALAEKMDAWVGRRLTRTSSWLTAAA